MNIFRLDSCYILCSAAMSIAKWRQKFIGSGKNASPKINVWCCNHQTTSKIAKKVISCLWVIKLISNRVQATKKFILCVRHISFDTFVGTLNDYECEPHGWMKTIHQLMPISDTLEWSKQHAILLFNSVGGIPIVSA